MNSIEEFKEEVKENIKRLGEDDALNKMSKEWLLQANLDKYCYNFRWLGRPIIQYPGDIIAMQEIVWEVKPDLIIETGIAHGGSLIFYASLLTLLNNGGHVLGIDIDIREHNRKEIEAHPMYDKITMLQGSSIDKNIVEQVHNFAKNYEKVLVVLDSNHSHAHVLEECKSYSSLVTKGSYLVVMDTVTEMILQALEGREIPEHYKRPWGVGDNPMTAVQEFLKTNNRFEIDESIDAKIQISACPKGFLKCIEN